MIIAISGKARSGKDTLARYLKDQLNILIWEKNNRIIKPIKLYEVFAIADEIKYAVQEKYGFFNEHLWGDKKDIPHESYPKGNGEFYTPRELTQNLANEKRKENENYWLDKLFNDHQIPNMIISDIRLKYEVDYIKDRGGIHIKLERANNPYKISGDGDKTENDLNDDYKVDYHILNDMDLNFLKGCALGFIKLNSELLF